MSDLNGLLVVAFAFGLSYLFTPLVRKFVIKIGAIDVPKDKRRMHKEPVPSMGGIAIYLSFLISMIIFIQPLTKEHIAMLFGVTIIFISGTLDDTEGLSPKMKILFQLIAAGVAIFGGIRVEYIQNPLGQPGALIDLGLVSYPLTIIWIVGITNAINLIDGMDGLAAGVSAIAALSLAALSYLHNNTSAALICLILAGACLGFLPYNFNPASIFMGDTGALVIGFLFSLISIEAVMKTAATVAIITPVIVLGVPISDTFLAIIRRTIIRRESFTIADKGHLHHKILDMGFSVKQTVVIIYIIAIILGTMAIVISQMGGLLGSLLALGVIVAIIVGARRIGMLNTKDEEKR